MAGSISIPIISSWNAKGIKNALGDIDDFKTKASRSFQSVADAGKKIAAGLAVGVAGGVAAGKALVDAGERASTSNARIGQIADSMGLFGAEADAVTDRLVKLAEAQALATGVDQNAIKATQAKLLTFGELAATADDAGGAFDRATAAAVDLAAAGFGTAEANAVQLGKALNDPVKGIAALAKSGVTFTDEQKELIASLVESGDTLGAQEIVLAAIEQQVGGTAEATANASDKMRVAFSLVAERIGTKLLPIFEKLVQVVVERLIPWMEDISARYGPKLAAMFRTIAERVGPIIRAIGDKLGPILERVGDWMRNNQRTVAVFFGVLAGAAVVAMIAALAAAVAALFSPVVLVVGAIAALAAGAYYLWTEFETVRTVVTTVFDAVRAVVETVVENIIGRFTALWDIISGVVEAIRGIFEGDLDKVLNGLREAFGGAVEFIYRTFIELPGKLLGFLGTMLTELGTWFVTRGLPKFAQWSASILDELVEFARSLPGTLFRLLSEAFERLGAFFTGTLIPKALGYGLEIGRAIIDGIVDGFQSLVSAAGGLASTLADAFVSAIRFVFNNLVADPVNAAVRGAVDSLDTLLGPFVNFPTPPNVIPRLAEGGIVNRPTLALIGEAGPEAVVPLDRYGSGGGVIVNVSGALDPTSVAEQIRRILNDDARRRGGVVL